MGILGRINRVIKSNVNELVDRMTDPAKEVDLLIVEMEEGFKQAKEEVVAATTDAKRYEKQLEQQRRECARWEERATQAVRAGDDELAREALRRKMEQENEERQLSELHAKQRAYVEELKDSLKALERRLKDVKSRRETLKQRARATKEGDAGLAGGKAFAEFDRLEGEIEAFEEVQQLSESLDQREAATEAKFARLERGGNPEIEDELAALKRKMEAGE